MAGLLWIMQSGCSSRSGESFGNVPFHSRLPSQFLCRAPFPSPYSWCQSPLVVPTYSLVAWQPEAMGLTTAEQIREAQSHAFTFAQLLDYGPWVFGIGYSTFAGVVGSLFAVATVTCVFMVPNRFLALATPWVVNLAVYFLMAVLRVAPISPNAFFPFNLTQGPMWEPFVPLAGLACVAAALLLALFSRVRMWDSWQ